MQMHWFNVLYLVILVVVIIIGLRRQARKDRTYFGKPPSYTKAQKKILDKHKNEYVALPDDDRLATMRRDGWELEDIAKSATEIIYQNPLPSKEERSTLRPGFLVKLKFVTAEDDDANIERMWVRVEGIEGGLYYGVLDNDALENEHLQSGKKIWFHSNHVFEIDGVTSV